MARTTWLVVLLVLISVRVTFAQPTDLVTPRNTPLLLLAHDLATNGVPPLSAPAAKLTVAGVGSVSAQGGTVSMVSTLLWSRTLDRGGSQYAADIEFDAEGNFCVVGSCYISQRTMFFVAKCSASGTTLWTNYFEDLAFEGSTAEFVAFDGSNNVYVAGVSGTYRGKGDVVLLKLSPDGVPQWTNRFNATGTNYHAVTGLAVDADGNAYVGVAPGIFEDSSQRFLLKYNPAGSLLWTNPVHVVPGETTFLFGPFMDGTGSLYLCGGGETFWTSAYFWMKYSSDGVALETNRFSFPGSTYARTAMMDSFGSVVISGEMHMPIRYFTARFGSDGQVDWTNVVAGPDYSGGYGPVLACDLNGNTFVTYGSAGAGTTNGDHSTVKIDAAGLPLWTNRWVSPKFGHGKTGTDNAGNFYLPIHPFEAGAAGIATLKVRPDGAVAWTNTVVSSAGFPTHVAVDPAGNIYSVGTVLSAITVMKYAESVRYTPPVHFVGWDSFLATVVDDQGEQAELPVEVKVEAETLSFNINGSNLRKDSNGLHLRLDGIKGSNPVILYGSLDLKNWQAISTNTAADPWVFIDDAATNQPHRFYRAEQNQ